jgi:hypothetical protein
VELQAPRSLLQIESNAKIVQTIMTDQDKQTLLVAPLEDDHVSPEAEPIGSQTGSAQFETSAIESTAYFLRTCWARVCIISGVLLIPCFWHRRIEAGDLASHTYNAWLAQLIERGQAPGLWIARQWNNIFFDVLLLRLGNLFGLGVAEKIAVSISVLIFFWGAFALIAATARRIPWFLVPCLMMFAYGWTFQMGFVNYYISLGLAFFGMALAEQGKRWEFLLLLVLAPLTWMAHPLGVVLLVGGAACLVLARRMTRRSPWAPLAAAAVSLVLISFYISSHYQVIWSDLSLFDHLRNFAGVDQIVLYSERYAPLATLLLVFILACVAWDIHVRLRAREALTAYRAPFRIFVIAALTTILIPRVIFLPQYAVPFSFMTERITSVTAIFGCCLLGITAPRKWHLAGFAVFAAVFFSFLYQDTGRLNRMDVQAERYERLLPPGQRIVATIFPFPGSRLLFNHFIDRGCIGHCFSYGNYEPSSRQFRVRANPGNRIVIASAESADDIELGEYVVQPGDLPIYQIFQCDLSMTELCMRELVPGEKNGRIGLHPVRNQ